MTDTPHLLFSFGTLLDAPVQQHIFGQRIPSVQASLEGSGFVEVPIDDPEGIAASGMSVHRGLVRKIDSSVEGGVLALSDEQLAQADQYEVSAYARRRVKFTDGRVVWAYVDAHALVAAERVAVIGDSIAYGRSDAKGGWARDLQLAHIVGRDERYRWWNLAIPGFELAHLEENMVPEVSLLQVDTVIISAGINDLAGVS